MLSQIDNLYKLISLDNISEAEIEILKLIQNDPKNSEYIFIYGIILARKKNFTSAIYQFRKTIDDKKYIYDSHFNIGSCYQGMGDFNTAISYFNKCHILNKSKYEPLQKIGICLRSSGEYQKSNQYLELSLKLFRNTHTIYLMASNQRHLGKFKEAKQSIKNLLNLDKENYDAILLLANIEMDEGNFEKSIKLIDTILQNKLLNENYIIAAKIDKGNVYKFQGDYDQAIKCYNKVLEIDQKNSSASYNLSICYLFLGKYKLGWMYHEERKNLSVFGNLRRRLYKLKKPLWDQTKKKEKILIWGEQGIGEQILYSQYIHKIEGSFKKIIIAVDEKIIYFFKNLFPKLEIISLNHLFLFKDFDFHLPMGSLGFNFHHLLIENKIVNNHRYTFQNNLIPIKKKKIRCGISWRSVNKLFGHKKSINLNNFNKIFMLNEIEFINLQFLYDQKEIHEIENKLNKKIFLEHQIDCFNDISGVASLINSCDLVITISNTNAHIGGKLNIKTLLLLPYSDGKLWYWGTENEKKIIWYPSITPIRQKKPNLWDDPINEIYTYLENLL